MASVFRRSQGSDQKISLEGSFEPGAIDFTGKNFRQVGPLVWSATVERAGEEIRIAGNLTATVESSCSRCLEPAAVRSKSFDLFFRERDEELFDEDDVELTEEDTRTAFFTGTQLAIGDILREQVLLALPMKALCRVDCKGLCPVCGTNLNSTAAIVRKRGSVLTWTSCSKSSGSSKSGVHKMPNPKRRHSKGRRDRRRAHDHPDGTILFRMPELSRTADAASRLSSLRLL